MEYFEIAGMKGGGGYISILRSRNESKGECMMRQLVVCFLCAVIIILTIPAAVKADAAEGGSEIVVSAAGAVLEVEDIVIRKVNDRVNFRVRVRNTGSSSANNLQGNLMVYLRVKDPQTGDWHELQQWSNIDSIKSGEEVARDFLPLKTSDPALLAEKFTLQAEIKLKADGGTKISKAITEKIFPRDAIKNP